MLWLISDLFPMCIEASLAEMVDLSRVVVLKLFFYHNPFRNNKNSHGLKVALIVTLVEKMLNNTVELKTTIMVISIIIEEEST